MPNKSKIEWTERTWNITSGCTKVSQGCKNCYAERLVSTRLAHLPQNEGVAKDGRWTGLVKCCEDKLLEPLKRKKPTTYFVCSQSDLFHKDVPFEFIDKALAVMALCPQHTFIVLTKRPERMREYLNTPDDFCKDRRRRIEFAAENLWQEFKKGRICLDWPLPNVWLGTSVEDQKAADERIPELLACHAAHRFLSCEPLLGPVDLRIATPNPNHFGCYMQYIGGIDLVIVGGESGPGARPMNPDWARSLRDQCKEDGVPFYFKQWGEWLPWTQFCEAGINDSPEQTRFDTLEWDGGTWKDVGRPSWFDSQDGYIDDIQCVGRVGKAKAGRLLEGVLHDDLPWRVK